MAIHNLLMKFPEKFYIILNMTKQSYSGSKSEKIIHTFQKIEFLFLRIAYLYYTFLPLALAVFSKQVISRLTSFRKWFHSFSGCHLRFSFPHWFWLLSLCLKHLDQFVWDSLCFGEDSGLRIMETSQVMFNRLQALALVLLYRILLSLFISAVLKDSIWKITRTSASKVLTWHGCGCHGN